MSSHPSNEASGRKVLHPLMGVVPVVAGGTVPLDFYMTKPIISGWSWVVAPIKTQEQRLGWWDVLKLLLLWSRQSEALYTSRISKFQKHFKLVICSLLCSCRIVFSLAFAGTKV